MRHSGVGLYATLRFRGSEVVITLGLVLLAVVAILSSVGGPHRDQGSEQSRC